MNEKGRQVMRDCSEGAKNGWEDMKTDFDNQELVPVIISLDQVCPLSPAFY